jgi:hypothetical protein
VDDRRPIPRRSVSERVDPETATGLFRFFLRMCVRFSPLIFRRAYDPNVVRPYARTARIHQPAAPHVQMDGYVACLASHAHPAPRYALLLPPDPLLPSSLSTWMGPGANPSSLRPPIRRSPALPRSIPRHPSRASITQRVMKHKTLGCNIRRTQIKHLKYTIATYVKHMQHPDKNTCNMCVKHMQHPDKTLAATYV